MLPLHTYLHAPSYIAEPNKKHAPIGKDHVYKNPIWANCPMAMPNGSSTSIGSVVNRPTRPTSWLVLSGSSTWSIRLLESTELWGEK